MGKFHADYLLNNKVSRCELVAVATSSPAKMEKHKPAVGTVMAATVLAPDTGHFIQDEQPSLVLEAIRQVEASARTGKDLPPCGAAFEDAGGECIPPGEIPTLVVT